MEKGHGRVERRTLVSTTLLNDSLPWPRVGQVFLLTRERTIRGQKTIETVVGITSLTRAQADAERLLNLVRGHWGIENRLFYVRDEAFGEDRCRVRRGNGPQLLAAVRNAALSLLRRQNVPNVTAALREHAYQVRILLKRVGILK